MPKQIRTRPARSDRRSHLRHRHARPVFPRWVAWYNIWVGLLLLPASLIIFFKTGILAWTGLLGFWIPASAFGIWYLVMTWILMRAINEEAEADRLLARTETEATVRTTV